MRVLVGSFVQESNTFSPRKSDASTFEDGLLLYGSASIEAGNGLKNELAGFLDVLRSTDAEIVPTVCAWASSGGPLTTGAMEEIVEDILGRVASAGPLDGVLLALHGSLVAEGEPDVDGLLLARIRRVLGPDIPLVVTLDMHANVTDRMLVSADAIVGYDTYPHLDMFETGSRAAMLLLKILADEKLPSMSACQVPLLLSPHASSTFEEPLLSIVRMRDELRKRDGILSASVFTVQPWLDVPELGSCVVVVAESGKAHEAMEGAAYLGNALWQSREEFDTPLMTPEEAVARANELEDGPVLLVDPADAVSAGSPGDGTAILRALLDADRTRLALVSLVDPVAACTAYEADGREVELDAGGSLDPLRNAPVRLSGVSKRLDVSKVTYSAGVGDGLTSDLGKAAVITDANIRILLTEKSISCYDPALYRAAGLEPNKAHIVVVKSPSNFKWTYRDIASEVLYVDAPGASSPKLDRLEFSSVPRPIFPLDDVGNFLPEGRIHT